MAELNLFAGEALVLLLSLAGLGGLVALGEGLRALGVGPEATRRMIHAGVSLFVAAAPLFFSGPRPLFLLAGLFVVVNAGARTKGWWRGMHEARPESWGTVALPLAVLPAVAATWSVGPGRVFALQTSFLVLAVADPLAAGVGQALGKREWLPRTTDMGSGAFFGATVLLVGVVLLGAEGWSLGRALGAAILVGIVATAVEALSEHGWDNLFVVLSVLLVLVPLHEGVGTVGSFGASVAVGGGVSGLAWWSRALDARGAVAGGLFAAALVGLGGWSWALPGFAFFVLSSALSWLPVPDEEPNVSDEQGGAERSVRQVMANGGVAWGLLGMAVLVPAGSDGLRPLCYAGFLGALAAAAADTWGTELGVRFAGAPRSLRTLRRVPPGTSGAISLVGTGAAALGAGSIVAAALLGKGGGASLSLWGLGVVAAGLAGMAVDSLAGATLEAQYQDPETGALMERPVPGASPVRGWAVVDNEVVNLLGTATGALVAIVLTGGLL